MLAGPWPHQWRGRPAARCQGQAVADSGISPADSIYMLRAKLAPMARRGARQHGRIVRRAKPGQPHPKGPSTRSPRNGKLTELTCFGGRERAAQTRGLAKLVPERHREHDFDRPSGGSTTRGTTPLERVAFALGWATARRKGQGGSPARPPKNPQRFEALSEAPNIHQTHPIAQTSPKLFLAVVGARCEIVLASIGLLAHING